MDKAKFLSILHHNADPSAQETEALNEVVQAFPYFQSARALELKGLHQHQNFVYNAALKITAAHTIDRSVLFDYITSPQFQQHSIASQIQRRENENTDIDREIDLDLEDAEKVLDPDLFHKKKIEQEEEETSGNKKQENPVKLEREEAHSFSDWLKLTRARPIDRSEDKKEEDSETENPGRQHKLIDRFIANNPKIKPPSGKQKQNGKALDQQKSSLMTETLAEVYLDQKNYDRAIQSYEILMLKNPQKSSYFADQIRLIEELKENK